MCSKGDDWKRVWAGAVVCLAMAGVSHAGQVSADPQGFLSVTAAALSDTYFTLPYHRPPAFDGLVQSVNGNTLTLQVPTGGLGWTAEEWVQQAEVQADSFYVLVGSGLQEGAGYPITANTMSTLTVNPGSVNLASTIAVGETIRIIPYWTLASLFPAQTGVATTASISGAGAGTLIMGFTPTAGINLAASQIYYYYNGTGFGGPGWRCQEAAFTTLYDNVPILPGAVLIYRNTTASAVNWTVNGAVQMAQFRHAVGTLSSGIQQDNLVGPQVGVGETLAGAGLLTSGVVNPTNSISGVSADLVLTYSGPTTGYNPAMDDIYYYYGGTAFGGPGWRRQGAAFTQIFDPTTVIQPGIPVMVRKLGAATPSTTDWLLLPGYLQ